MKNRSTLASIVLWIILIFATDKFCLAQWFPQPSHLSPNNFPQFIDAVDTNIVWAVAQDQEFTKTTNGGFSWEAGTINNAAGFGPSSIYALSADTAWVAMYKLSSAGGRILKTTDGGANWVYQSTAHFSGAGAFADFVFFWDSENGVCVGDPTAEYFEIYTTTNGGTNWIRTPSANIPLPLTGEYGLQDDYATYGDSTIWFGTHWGRVYKSVDRGVHWIVATTPFFDNYVTSVGCIAFKDALHGSAGTGYNLGITDVIYTEDGGLTWSILGDTGDSLPIKLAMQYLPGTSGTYFFSGDIAVGSRGSAFSTDDGNSWTTIDAIGHTNLDFVNASTGWSGSNEFDSVSNSYLIYRWGSPGWSEVNPVKTDNFSLSVFPNPFSESFVLKNSTAEKATLKVFDVQGNLLLQQQLRIREEISLGENFPAGIYLMQLRTATQTFSIKAVKIN
ncbi:MAG TPA: T9SS type A sorting domain-containing protein [Chitinophagales bacterium]|nr:T9SS type A sorting domain-containing protein [Chitinophagales bacterium]